MFNKESSYKYLYNSAFKGVDYCIKETNWLSQLDKPVQAATTLVEIWYLISATSFVKFTILSGGKNQLATYKKLM